MSAPRNPWKAKPALKSIVRLLRKRWWKKSYAQNGEDMVLLNVFHDLKQGVYVDVGCFHPRLYSNTRALHERGWWGVNIDLSPRKVGYFDFDRPKDHNVCCAVSAERGELTAYTFGLDSALDTTDKATAEEWRVRFDKTYDEVTVPSRPLDEILDEHGVEAFDFLNIDVEGAEMLVLQGIDLKRYRPRAICIEIHGDLDAARDSDVYRHLTDAGYTLHAWLAPSFIFTTSDA